MKIIITGAGGFLGQHLINYLHKTINEDFSIYSLGNKKIPNCKNYNIDDILDKEQINLAISSIKPDYLFHLAGTSDKSLDEESIKSVNIIYANNLLSSLEKNNLHNHTKIIIVGSSAEYGNINPNDLPINEDLKPKPKSIYGKTKYEQTLNSIFWQQRHRKLVVVRPFNIIGENIPKHLAIGNFFSQIHLMPEKGFLKTGNLNIKRDFIDVFDVVCIMWKLINSNKAYGEVVNICTGIPSPLIDLVNLMINLSKKEIKCIIEKSRVRNDDIIVHYGDNKKLINMIGNYEFIFWKKTINKIMKA
ncbi:NAD(P)-dependent oxidoreductase [Flavobacteriaceae bacterium]|nr:NAD(P)-dependent oxidoreductase [Flavobacteriaceae bacterium]